MMLLGMLELAVLRVIRENPYQMVPLPGAVWVAVRKELGNPHDVHAAIEAWCEARWGMIQLIR
jgi:hypothetical protein